MPVEDGTSKILTSILFDITNTQRVIDKTEKVKQSLKVTDLVSEQNIKDLVDQTKDIIDELKNEVLEISATFYKFYDNSIYGETQSNENVSETAIVNGDVNINGGVETPNLEKGSKDCVESTENSNNNNNNNNNNKEKENHSAENEGEKNQNEENCKTKKDNSKHKEAENVSASTVETQLIEETCDKETIDNENSSTDIKPKDEQKTWLRCVDISKLIDQASTNNLNNDNNASVVILSDSDSSSSPIKLPSSLTLTRLPKQTKLRNRRSSDKLANTPTKGVLKSPLSEISNSKKKKKVSFRDPETSDIEDQNATSSSCTLRSKLLPRKTKPVDLHDVSSLSEDSSDSSSSLEFTLSSKKQMTAKQKKGRRPSSPIPTKISAEFDAKFSQKCFVKLVKVHPNTLKRNYEKLLLKNEVKRLTNTHSLKRSRKERHNSSSSDSSSASEKECKRARTEKKKPEPTKKTLNMDVVSSSDSDVADSSTNIDPLETITSTDDLNTNATTTVALEENPLDVLEITENVLEELGNDSQDKNSDEASNSNSDVEKSAKQKKPAEENKETEEPSPTTDEAIPSTTKEGNKSSAPEKSEKETDKTKKKADAIKKKWRKDKLLTASLSSSSDSEDGEEPSTNKKHKHSKKKNEEKKSADGDDDSSNSSETNKRQEKEKEKDGDADKEKNDGEGCDESNLEEGHKDKDVNHEMQEKLKKNDKPKDVAEDKIKDKEDDDKEKNNTDSDNESNRDDGNEGEDESNNKGDGSSSDSDIVVKKKKTTKKKKVDESDTDENFAKFLEKNDKIQEKTLAKKRRRAIVNSDSDSSSSAKKKSDSSEKESSSSSSSDSGSEKERNSKQATKRRRRIKKVNDSSDEDGDDKSTRRHIRKVWTKDSLAESTIAAEKEESERKARILEKQKKYNQIFEPDALEKSTVDKVVLDFEEEEELLVVHKDITKHLKPHQAKGVQFMWNASFESVKRAKKHKGSGCILAHCMGLGKTLQVITLIHTLLSDREKTKVERALVVCPLSTVLNWVAEFKKWLPDDDEVNVFDIVAFKQNIERLYQIKEWERCGGVLVLGYDMFRNLTNSTGKRMSKKLREGFQRCLVDPGPDLVICDEGHLLKNEKTSLSIAMNKIKTARRIVLTGTPLQNNLKEYWCMVQFVKPNLLGTYKEYLNRFVNPIVNGQYTDSTQHDIQLMRKRSHVLHKLLDGVVQRRDYAVLAPFLPPKHEYVLFVSLSEKQIQLYEHYMKEKARRTQSTTTRTSFLFVDFQELQRICTHPRVLLDKSIANKIARDKKELEDEDEESEGSLKDFINDDSDKTDTPSCTSSNDSGSGSDSNDSKKKVASKGRRVTRAAVAQGGVVISDTEEEQPNNEPDPLEWWREFVNDEDLDDIQISGKLSLLFEILRHCESIGDKVLIFSQSLYSLNVIEHFLSKVDDATQNSESGAFCGFSGSWSLGLDYFRLDGSSSCDNRAAWCNTFNNPDNTRARLFLISTRAGGLGINLVAANRVIIFDVSWNPSHDTQSIYRVYRFGQNKPSYIYRFVTLGTMEMKIYERQVIKQAISKRVIDEQQIDRHYNQNDIAELYRFEPKPEGERPIPLVPVDVLLGELLQHDQKIYKYHEHHSLLENKEDEVLDEEERKAAWEEFENEKKARQFTGSINHIPIASIVKALTSILSRESPALTPQMIQDLIPNMLQELQEKMALGDQTLYKKVLNEIRLMQASVQQQRIEEYYRLQQQQQQNLLLQQYRHQLMVNPVAAAQFMNQWNQQTFNTAPGATNQGIRMPFGSRTPQNMTIRMPGPKQPNAQQTGGQQTSSTEVIELND